MEEYEGRITLEAFDEYQPRVLKSVGMSDAEALAMMEDQRVDT
jgi:hypothetical protein